jgi:hypothetical protein
VRPAYVLVPGNRHPHYKATRRALNGLLRCPRGTCAPPPRPRAPSGTRSERHDCTLPAKRGTRQRTRGPRQCRRDTRQDVRVSGRPLAGSGTARPRTARSAAPLARATTGRPSRKRRSPDRRQPVPARAGARSHRTRRRLVPFTRQAPTPGHIAPGTRPTASLTGPRRSTRAAGPHRQDTSRRGTRPQAPVMARSRGILAMRQGPWRSSTSRCGTRPTASPRGPRRATDAAAPHPPGYFAPGDPPSGATGSGALLSPATSAAPRYFAPGDPPDGTCHRSRAAPLTRHVRSATLLRAAGPARRWSGTAHNRSAQAMRRGPGRSSTPRCGPAPRVVIVMRPARLESRPDAAARPRGATRDRRPPPAAGCASR